ncbi:hypothetical protein [Pseudoalteromonas byunsanensis]|nr:hypothetical protein [Pseudoalteromonas byunsanensis]
MKPKLKKKEVKSLMPKENQIPQEATNEIAGGGWWSRVRSCNGCYPD